MSVEDSREANGSISILLNVFFVVIGRLWIIFCSGALLQIRERLLISYKK